MAFVEPTTPVALHLHIRVRPGQEAKLIEFLRSARAFYEAPGGIRVRLLQDAADPLNFIEIIEYDNLKAFDGDDLRVRADSTMQRYLNEWRALLEGDVEVKKYLDLTSQLER